MISTFLEDIKDHRRSQGQRYKLEHIILFSIMAFLSNAKSYRDISRFIRVRFEVLKEHFGLTRKKAPETFPLLRLLTLYFMLSLIFLG